MSVWTDLQSLQKIDKSDNKLSRSTAICLPGGHSFIQVLAEITYLKFGDLNFVAIACRPPLYFQRSGISRTRISRYKSSCWCQRRHDFHFSKVKCDKIFTTDVSHLQTRKKRKHCVSADPPCLPFRCLQSLHATVVFYKPYASMNAKNFPIKCDHHYVISLVTAIE